MCLTIPVKIIKVKNGSAIVKERKKERKIDIRTIPSLKDGDWILTHANMAIKKIPKKEAEQIVKIIGEGKICPT